MPAPSTPSPRSRETLGERLAETARARPVPPRAKRWVWLVLFGVVALLILLQALGVLTSPVERTIRDRAAPESDAVPRPTGEGGSSVPPAPPSPPPAPSPDPAR